MSFSPLNPRGRGQRLSRTQASGKVASARPRHLSLWEAIRVTRDELSSWQQRADGIEALFRRHILPRETRLTEVHSDLTERLMDRHEVASLGASEQALLSLWITDNLGALVSHPFAADERRTALNHRWREIQKKLSDSDDAPARTKPCRSRTSLDELFDDELDDDDEVFDFGWHGNDAYRQDSSKQQAGDRTSRTPAGKHEPDDTSDSDENRQSTGDTARETDINDKISRLEQGLSVERLFRQLARTLHPDREQDEARKAEKHELMSECLLARQNKDINTLLTLYCEHIGDLPDDVSGNDHEELIQALEEQLRQLQNQLRHARFGNPLLSQIIERYSSADENQSQERISRHADTLDTEISRLRTLLQRLETDEGLLAELAVRREIEQDRMMINRMTGHPSPR